MVKLVGLFAFESRDMCYRIRLHDQSGALDETCDAENFLVTFEGG